MLRLYDYVNEWYTIMMYLSIGNEDNMKSIVHSNTIYQKSIMLLQLIANMWILTTVLCAMGKIAQKLWHGKRSPAQKLFYDYEKKCSFILAYCTMSCKLSNEAKCIYELQQVQGVVYIRTKTLKRGILYFFFKVPLFLQMFFSTQAPVHQVRYVEINR